MTFYPIFWESLVSRARNAATAAFLADKEATHLFFIDSDIEFDIDDIIHLINANEEVIAGIYPKKYIKWEALKKNPSAERVDFPVGSCTVLENGLIETKYAPTGFLMIAKSAIQKIIKEKPELKYKNDIDGYMESGDNFYNIFNVGVRNGIYESEDWGFSSIWQEVGGKVYIHPEVNVKHIGWHTYEGNLKKYIEENTI